jgi:MYXO-CTERM domain-containing protein
MTSTHEALVRRPLDEVRQQLQDPDQVLPALPGAALSRGEDGVSGSLKLKLGTLQITYRVTIRATGPEGGDHAATVAIAGKQARGAGTLAATVDVQLHEAEDGTLLRAALDLTATGRGESVSADAWGHAADTLLAGVVSALTDVAASNGNRPTPTSPPPATPVAAGAVAATPAPAPRPVPLVAAPPREPVAAPAVRPSGPSPQRLAAAAVLLLLLLAVLRRRRRGR